MLSTGILATSATAPSSFSRHISTSFYFTLKYFEMIWNISSLKASRISGDTPVRSLIRINCSLLLPILLLPFSLPLRSHRLIFSNTFRLLSIKSKESSETSHKPTFSFTHWPHRDTLSLNSPRYSLEGFGRFRIL